MSLELGRRLINGIWKTEVADEESGGGGSGAFLSTTVTLTAAEILTLPSTPVELVAPTEILDYGSPPSSLPFPLMCNGWLKMSEAWDNVGNPVFLDLCWGSDYSSLIGRAVEWLTTDPPGFNSYGNGAFSRSGNGDWAIPFVLAPNPFGGAGYQDNGIYVAVSQNGSPTLGDFTGGDPDATLTLTTFYYVNELPA